VLRLDFGNSVSSGQPFTPQLMAAALNSFWLLLLATLIGLTLGVALGLYAAYHPHSWQDNTIKILALLFIALPGWYMITAFDWANAQLWLLTGQRFSIMPLGKVDPATSQFWGSFLQPVFFQGAILLALFWSQTRSQALVVLKQDYVRTATAKGLPARKVLFWHVLRNSLTPIISIFGGLLPFVFASQILIEKVTFWDGLSRVFLQAAYNRDYTVLMGVFTLLALVCVACSYLADLAYALVDPKLREKYRGGMALAKPDVTGEVGGLAARKKRKQLRLGLGIGLAALVIIAAGLLVSNPLAGKTTGPAASFEALTLPADAKILFTDTTTGERKSFLVPRYSNGIQNSPEPEQDVEKESKRTIFATRSTGLDLLRNVQPDLEAQGWAVSETFKNQANISRVDYVFEKDDKYFWLSADTMSGISYDLRSPNGPLAGAFDKVNQGDTIAAVVQGFKPGG
jgi:peptide/nickel transport system permease protein